MTKGWQSVAFVLVVALICPAAFAAGPASFEETFQRWQAHRRWEAKFDAKPILKATVTEEESKVEEELYRGYYNFRKGEFELAVEQLAALRQAHSGTTFAAEAAYWLGIAEGKRGNLQAAQEWLEAAIDESGGDWSIKKGAYSWLFGVKRALADRGQQRACGVRALSRTLAYMGETEASKAIGEAQVSDDEALSLQELANLARAQGVPAWGIRANAEAVVAELEKPLVAVVKPRHYVVVVSAAGGMVQLDDPDRGVRDLERSEFASKFAGFCLVFTEDSLSKGEQLTALEMGKVLGGAGLEAQEPECADDGEYGGGFGQQGNPNCRRSLSEADRLPMGGPATPKPAPAAPSVPCGASSGGVDTEAFAGRSLAGSGCAYGGTTMAQPHVYVPQLTVAVEATPLWYDTGTGLPFRLSLTYNHADTSTGPFGNCWSSNITRNVTEDAVATFRQRVGRDVDYTYNQGSGKWEPEAGFFDEVTKDGNGVFTKKVHEEYTTVIFNTAADGGTTDELRDERGNTTQFYYNANDIVTRITDAASRNIDFLVDGSNRVTKVTAPTGETAEFYYGGAGNLTKIVDMAGQTSSFLYNGSNYVTKVTNPLGITSFTYELGPEDCWQVETMTTAEGEVIDYGGPAGTNTFETREGETVHCSWTPSQQDWLLYIEFPSGRLAEYMYGASGAITKVKRLITTNQNYVWERYYYDASGYCTKLTIYETESSGELRSTSYLYDSAGNRTKSIDPEGRASSYFYDGQRTLTKVTYPDSSTESFFYTSAGFLTKQTDRSGNDTTYGYDSYGYLTRTTEPESRATSYLRDTSGRLTKLIDAESRETTYLYDSLGRLTRTTYPDSSYTTTSYGCCAVNSQTDEEGNATTYSYDKCARVTRTTYADSSYVQYLYNEANRITRATDQEGVNTTYYYYNTPGVVTKITRPTGAGDVSYLYDNGLRLTRIVEPGSEETAYLLDELQQITKITDAEGGNTTRLFDKVGNLTRVTDAEGHSTSYFFDSMDRLTRVTDPGGRNTSYYYDVAGSRTRVTDPAGQSVSYLYDALGQLTRTTYPDSSYETQMYDKVGSRTKTIDPEGNETAYLYDSRSRLTRVTDPEGKATVFLYDKASRRTKVTDPLSHNTVYYYDTVGRLTKVEDSLGNATVYLYDKAGRRTKVTDAEGHDAVFLYEANGRLTKVTDAESRDVTYLYDQVGNRTRLTDARSNATSFYYDKLNRLTRLAYPNTDAEVYYYDKAGWLTRKTRPDGTGVWYQYDAAGRLTRVTEL